MEEFIVCVFTSPGSVEAESEKIRHLIDAGVDFVHIRKPNWDKNQLSDFLKDFGPDIRKRFRLHDYHDLNGPLSTGGVHLNSRNPYPPEGGGSFSTSVHSILDLNRMLGSGMTFDYLTLSPIFDSISKKDYMSKFEPSSISAEIRGKRVVGLGGVTPERLLLLKSEGFYGGALLGYIWEGCFEERLEALAGAIRELKTP